jgi:hypothetical protein
VQHRKHNDNRISFSFTIPAKHFILSVRNERGMEEAEMAGTPAQGLLFV